MDAAIGVISLLVAHFISVYITQNLVTYFGVLVGASVLAGLLLQRYVAAASQLISVVDTAQVAAVPATMDGNVCAALMHDPVDHSTLDGTFTSYDGLPLNVTAHPTATASLQPQEASTGKTAFSCDVSLNRRMASYGT